MHSPLSHDEVPRTLARAIDHEQRAWFSLTGYVGYRAVIGLVGPTAFQLHQRHNLRNDFAPVFYGQLWPEQDGTRIEGYFDQLRWVRDFMRLWLVTVGAMGALFVTAFVIDRITGSHVTSSDSGVLLLVFPLFLLFGFLVPKVGGLFAKDDEEFLLEFVQRTLSAELEAGENSQLSIRY